MLRKASHVLLLLLLFTILNIAAVSPISVEAGSASDAILAGDKLTPKTNVSLGSTIEIQRPPCIDTDPPPRNSLNKSRMLQIEEDLPEDNQTRIKGGGWLYLTPGEYFPDVSVARITKNLWIDNPYWGETDGELDFCMSNPDEKYSRIFRVYLDGVKVYDRTLNTKRLQDSVGLLLSDGVHEIVFQISYGGYEKGWALEEAHFYNSEHINMFDSSDLAKDELFPLASIAKIEKYVYIKDLPDRFDEMLHVAVQSNDIYSRWLRVRVNDQLVYSRIISGSWEVTIDVSTYMSDPGIYKVTVEIQYGAYAQWNLVYLALERSASKHVPMAFELTLSFEAGWNPAGTPWLDDFIAGLRQFADHVFSALEEQLIITRITMYPNGIGWANAHICVHNDPNMRAYADSVGGMRFHLPKNVKGLSWTNYGAYTTITHELAHSHLWVYDEYEDDTFICCGQWWDSHSVMDNWWIAYPLVPKTEFCVRNNHDPDGDTQQSIHLGVSCWETFVAHYLQMYEPFVVYLTGIDEVAADYVEVVWG